MCHGLLVLATPGRQRVADTVQCLADAGDVAVAEDRPHPLDEALALLGHLDREPLDHRLSGGQTYRFHAASSLALLRAASQMLQRRVKFRAIVTTASSSSIRPTIQSRAA